MIAKISPVLVLICSILLSEKILADYAAEEYPNLSCHDGYNTPDDFGLVVGPFTKNEALDICNNIGIDGPQRLTKTHECYRQCMMEFLFVLKVDTYHKNNLEWSHETAKLLSEEDMAEGMRNRLFYTEVTGNDTASRLAREIHLKCTDKAIKLESRPCKEWKAFNDCVDSIWLCKSRAFVSEKFKTIIGAAKVSDVNHQKNSGFIIQNRKETNFLLFSLFSMVLVNIGL